MSSFQPQKSDVTLNYMLTFIEGNSIRIHDSDKTPENVKYSKLDPERPLGAITPKLYSVEYKIDASRLTCTSVNEIYFLCQLPAQTIAPGQFFTYTSLAGLKMINRVDIMFKTYDNVIESISPATLYNRLLEKYAETNDDKWAELTNAFFGATSPRLNYKSIPAQPVLIPLVCDLFPLNLNKLFPTPETRLDSAYIYVKIWLNTVDQFSIRSADFQPYSYVDAAGVITECNLIVEERNRVAEPPAVERHELDYHAPGLNSYVLAAQRSIRPRTDYVRLAADAYINKLSLFMYNPFISSTSLSYTFYGRFCYNALLNYINSHLRTSSADAASDDLLLNLKTGLVVTAVTDKSPRVTTVSTNTYRVQYGANVDFQIVSGNMDWQALPDTLFMAIGPIVRSKSVPASALSKLYMYVLPAWDGGQPLPAITDGTRVADLTGLYHTPDGQWVVHGFGNATLKLGLSAQDMLSLKLGLSLPVEEAAAKRASIFCRQKFCVYRDPIFIYGDLDESYKYCASELEVLATNRATMDSSTSKANWATDMIQNYSNSLTEGSTFTRYVPATVFNFGARIGNFGYLDTVLTEYEINYQVGFADSITNRPITLTAEYMQDLVELFNGLDVRVDYVYALIRFLVYSRQQIYAYTVNTSIYNEIIKKYYNGVTPRHLDVTKLLNEYRQREQRKRPRGALV